MNYIKCLVVDEIKLVNVFFYFTLGYQIFLLILVHNKKIIIWLLIKENVSF